MDETLATILTGVLTTLAAYLVAYLNRLRAKAIAEIERSAGAEGRRALDLLDHFIELAVKEVMQTYVRPWKKLTTDNKLTLDQKMKVKREAVDSVKKMSRWLKVPLSPIELDKYIGSKIEASVYDCKPTGHRTLTSGNVSLTEPYR